MTEESKDQGLVFEETQQEKKAAPEEKPVKKKADSGSKSEEKSVPAKKVVPKLFFKRDERIEIVVNGYHDAETGDYAFGIIADSGADSDQTADSSAFIRVQYKFYFTPCSYDKLSRYRSYSMIYNQEDQTNTINLVRLREFFLINHLVDWNLTDEDGNKVELQFDPNRTLSRKTLDLVYTLPSNLLDIVLVTYERRIGASV